MTFDFTAANGHTYHLDTEGGEVHCEQVDAPAEPIPLEPSEDGNG